MKKILNILFFACIVLFFFSCGKDDPETPPEPPPVASVPDTLKPSGQMPIVGWYGIPPEETTETRYKEMKDAGFTHNLYPWERYPTDVLQKALDVADATGMKIFLWSKKISEDPENTVPLFMNHPALAGYFLADEPSTSQFAELADLIRRIQAVDNTHTCYVVLFPSISTSRLEAPDWQTYVNTFINTVPPLQFYSYDRYPFTGDVIGEFSSVYYKDLEIFSDEAKKAGKPFWVFAQATAIPGSMPIPTTTTLRLQMFSNLAYGAQGLQYYTYWTPSGAGWGGNSDGPIYNGNRTEVYDMVKKVNEEIKGLSGVFLGSKVVSVAHTGSSIPEGTQRLTQLPKEITAFETVGEGAVVSVLERDDMAFLVVVNRDFKKTMNLSVKCDAAATVRKVLKNGTVPKEPVSILKADIEAGDIAVFMWEKTGALEYKPL